jgi:hypothetical protein
MGCTNGGIGITSDSYIPGVTIDTTLDLNGGDAQLFAILSLLVDS